MDNNIFKNADFWQSKGYVILSNSTEIDSVNVALDYFLSGVKIEPNHFDCIYNVGCCHFAANKFANARKWFNLAIKVNSTCADSYYGLAVACIKLGLYAEALQAIETIDKPGDKYIPVTAVAKDNDMESTQHVFKAQ